MQNNLLQKGKQLILSSSLRIQKYNDTAASRALHITGVSGVANVILGISKLLSGMLALSMLVCVNGLYTLGMVAARYYALAGVIKAESTEKQYEYYGRAGIILTGTSLLYIAYSVWMYFHPVYIPYSEYMAITIAAFTFGEIGVNVRGIFVFRREHTPLIHGIKMINLAASLTSLVLTQSALLSFADTSHDMSSSGILGILMGTCAVIMGSYMILKSRKRRKGEDK